DGGDALTLAFAHTQSGLVRRAIDPNGIRRLDPRATGMNSFLGCRSRSRQGEEAPTLGTWPRVKPARMAGPDQGWRWRQRPPTVEGSAAAIKQTVEKCLGVAFQAFEVIAALL